MDHTSSPDCVENNQVNNSEKYMCFHSDKCYKVNKHDA